MAERKNITYGELIERLEVPMLVIRTNGTNNPVMRSYASRLREIEKALRDHCAKVGGRIPHNLQLPDEVVQIYEDFRQEHNSVMTEKWPPME